MKILRLWVVGALLVCGVGCEKYVVSLKPLCTDESCVAVPGLEGKWANDDQVWTVRPREGNTSEIRVADVFSTGQFCGRARRIGDKLYLELNPEESVETPVPSLYAAHWLQASSFMQVQLAGDALNLKRMNSDSLKKALEEKPGLIKHVFQDDHVILAAETEALVQFVQAQADVNELWQEHGEFVRCSPLYSTQDLIRSEGFVGRWLDPNDNDHGRIDVSVDGDHYRIQFTSESDEHLEFSAHLFKIQDLTLMGVFLGTKKGRVKEMETLMPDWFAVVTLKKDRLALSILDYQKMKEVLASPEKASEVQTKSDVKLIRVKPQ